MTDREFCKLYELSRPFYERIAFSYMYDKEEARDIVTDCFLYLWRHRQEVEDRNIKGYLYFAVHNRCLSCLRSRKSLQKTKDEIEQLMSLRSKIAVQNLSGGDPVYSDEILLLFRQALGNMPEKIRRVFEASRQGGLTYQKIAIKYGITVRQVSSEIQLALKTFRLALKDYLEIGR